MTAIDVQLAALRTAINDATRKRARAQVEHDQATESLRSTQQALKDEFGVENTEQAKAKLVQLRAAVDEALAEAQQALEAANA
jgi:ATP phosphoribosyltransferase regulatory subunit HisZ